MADSPHIVLFDLYSGGHHRMYLELLCRYWIEHELPGTLEVLVTEDFCQRHPAFRRWVEESSPSGLALSAVSPSETPKEGNLSLPGVLENDRIHGDTLVRRLKTSIPDHVLFMYFDHCQVSLARRKIRKVACSGIYFRPSFHYANESLFTKMRKSILLKRALKNPVFRHLFCLDPYVVPLINESHADLPAVALPDGYSDLPSTRDRDTTRRDLGITRSRSVVLFFGVVSSRKGIYEAIDALSLLPAHRQSETTFLVAGMAPQSEVERVRSALLHLEVSSSIHVVNLDRFVDEEEIGDYFGASDLALVTYQKHIGSSNVLIRAASAGLPVVGSDYGLVGMQIRQHSLGLSVDTTESEILARAIEQILWDVTPGIDKSGDRQESHFNSESAAAFARDNSAERFAETIFSSILGSDS